MLQLPLALVSVVAWITGAKAGSRFLSPPGDGDFRDYRDNPQYHVGERMNIRWQTDLEAVNVLLLFPLFGESGGTATMQDLRSNITNGTYEWTVNMQGIAGAQDTLDKEGLAILYLAIYPTPKGDVVAKSHYFNVTAAGSPKKSTTTMPTPTTSSASSMTTATATTTDTEPDGSHSSTGSSSNGAVIGGAVGGTLGGLLVLGVIGVLLRRLFRRQHTEPVSTGGQKHFDIPIAAQSQVQNELAELDGSGYTAELGSFPPQNSTDRAV